MLLITLTLVFILQGYHESPRGELFFETQCTCHIGPVVYLPDYASK